MSDAGPPYQLRGKSANKHYEEMRAGTATGPLRDQVTELQREVERERFIAQASERAAVEYRQAYAKLEDENKGLKWLVQHYEAALTIIKRKDIIEGIRSDFLK